MDNHNENNLSFEDALKKLEEIVQKLEDGNLSLEESINIYEEGMKLSQKCNNILKSIEHKLVLIEKINQEFTETDITNNLVGGLGQEND
ncbi:exodeoxyribonuclease VII small subunit [Caldicellulosiruptoraceae bacterium PP1]